MSYSRPRRPPLRRCVVCGGSYVGWRELDACGKCKRESVNAERKAVADAVTEVRAGRGGSSPEAPEGASVPYNEFPEGF
jgi:hypothetical protein